MKMKKMLAVVSALCMMNTIMPILPSQEIAVILANAEDAEYTTGTYENLSYRKCADHIEIFTVDDKKNITEANIPAEIEGLPVTSIDSFAFQSCPLLTSVTLPDSLTTIGSWAFSYCSSLTSVTIPDSLTTIEAGTFENCPALTPVTLPDNLTTIGNSAFKDCPALTSVTLPDSLTTIGVSAFEDCSALTSVTLPNNLTTIESSAFWKCSSLTSVTIPDSVASIGSMAFTMPNLTDIEVSENNPNYASVDGVLFNKDKTELLCYPAGNSRTEYIVSANVTSIPYGAFTFWENQYTLNSVTIENPDCEIPAGFIKEFPLNVSDGRKPPTFNGIIYGYENSTAQKVAEEVLGYQFAVISSAPETSETESESTAEEYQQGDASGDGKVDVLDVITINKAAMGKETLSPEQLKAIDFNQNSKPDSEEALMLLKYIVGLITSFEA